MKAFPSAAARWRSAARIIGLLGAVALPVSTLWLIIAVVHLIYPVPVKAQELLPPAALVSTPAHPEWVTALASRSLRADLVPPPLAAPVAVAAPAALPPPTLDLVAIVGGSTPRAYLRSGQSQKIELVKVGSLIQGCKVTQIADGHITLDRDGVTYDVGVARK